MADFENDVTAALKILKKEAVKIHGRNKNIELYYNIWRGEPDWLPYNYKLPDGTRKEAKLLTLNAPRYMCRTWANNYANEDTKLTISNEKSNDRLQEILENTNFFGRFNNFVEMFMGLGIGGTVVETDALIDEEGNVKKTDGELKIRMIPGRRVIPITVDDGEVTECAFVSYFTGGARLTIHYLVEGIYHLAIIKAKWDGNVGNYSFDMKNLTDIKLSTIPLFQIWNPNVTDEDEVDKCIGTSILATALDSFKQCDLGYTAYYKEIKLGQKTKFISTDQVRFNENGEVLPFDENDESVIYIQDANQSNAQMSEFNADLRIEAITKFINTNLNCAAMLCGLGQTQFEFDGAGGRPIQTATGVIAKQSELYRNVIKQENLATGCFKKLVNAIVYVNNTFLKKPQMTLKSLSDIQVTYDDNIVEDTASKKQAELQEVNAGVMSIAEFRSHWYGESVEEATKFLQDNGMLLDKYTLALQSKVITPEMFVEFAFGKDYEHKDELVAYIKENLATPQDDTGFEDESDNDTPKEEEDKDDE